MKPSLSALARSPACQELLSFAHSSSIDNEADPDVACHVNGRLLSGLSPVESKNDELIVNLAYAETPLTQMGVGGVVRCSVHLSTLLQLAIGFIEFQYEAVSALLVNKGESIGDMPENSPEVKALLYATLIARHGLESNEVDSYWTRNSSNKPFVEMASIVRLKARIAEVIMQESKIEQTND